MFSLSSSLRYLLYYGSCDMRKSFDGLCGLIENDLNTSPTTGDVYVFLNKRRDKIKLLHWSGGGFVLYYKRLESGTFEKFNYDISSGSIRLNYSQMVMLIDGISIKNVDQKKRYSLPEKTA